MDRPRSGRISRRSSTLRNYADTGDALASIATDATVTSLVRTARWARAWIRAASEATALAGASAPSVSFTGGGGSGATAMAVASGGVVTAVVVVDGGTGYTTAPTVAFSGGGGTTAATATAHVSNGAVTRVTVDTGGAGYSPATWTNQGPGTAPTGAHWNIGDVPDQPSAQSIWELTSFVTPVSGSNYDWNFGPWRALEVTAANTQYSVDGSTGWHTARDVADRYERHRENGAWGAAFPLYAADELAWTRLLAQTIVTQGTAHNPYTIFELPATINFNQLKLMQIRLAASTTVPVYEGSVVVDPAFFVAADHASRASGQSVGVEWYWGCRLDGRGLGVVKGDPLVGYGPTGDATDTGLVLSWHRPAGVSSANEARYLRVLWMRNRGVNHRLTIEAI